MFSEQKKTLEALERFLVSASKAVSNVGCNELVDVDFGIGIESVNDKSGTNLHQSESSFSPLSRKKIPDHYVDPSTKLMYLTPLGRKQVGSSYYIQQFRS